ncbi:MAG TPA: class I SAM-dependent methyltransferase [Caulifigura sp.]|jgi:2-polyprenyl-3-methyl-5-hydroxy-6-metoxy-1,4-benzoquinol methylase|nr:class I SAM-dependent methyltransferase [Caulifigura sp.]
MSETTLDQALVTRVVDGALTLSSQLDVSFANFAEYNETLKTTFYRTVSDVERYARRLKSDRSAVRILEIGAFTGVVSVALAKLGYTVTATDMPFVINHAQMQEFFLNAGISTLAHDLTMSTMPVAPGSFDIIVFAEVLEHLNWNPLLTLQEFHRILAPGGAVYCATPNLASLKNRASLATGKGFYSPISHLKVSLIPDTGASVGIHWREYTKSELCELYECAGFELVEHSYCLYNKGDKSRFPRRQIVRTIYRLWPGLMQGQCAVFRKRA